MSFEARFAKIMELSRALPALKDRLISLAARDLNFTAKDTAHEVDLTVDRLHLFAQNQWHRPGPTASGLDVPFTPAPPAFGGEGRG